MNIRTNITKVMLSILIGVAVATSADAANTMCVTSDNTNIILDPSIEGTSSTGISENMTWTATFPNYTVSGIATCNSTKGESARAYPEYNFDNNHASSEGVYCWCRMTSPVRSAWVYRTELSSASDCASACASRCGYYVQSSSAFRGPLYNTAGM